MSKARRRRKHIQLVRWSQKLPTSPAQLPPGNYSNRMFTAPIGPDTALGRAANRVWRDISHRDPWTAWIWAPR